MARFIGEEVTHTFTTTGKYSISLDIENKCGEHRLDLVITVEAACTPLTDLEVAFSPLKPKVDELVTFSASANGSLPISYTWDFGDGFTAEGEVAVHAFNIAGINMVRLQAQNPCTSPPLEVQVGVLVEAIIHRYHLPIISK
jgi:PKD repeat protein